MRKTRPSSENHFDRENSLKNLFQISFNKGKSLDAFAKQQ